MQTKENTNQDTNVDVTSNIIEYNVQENGISAIYVDDYNMVIQSEIHHLETAEFWLI